MSSLGFLSLAGTERELGAQGGGGREERVALKGGLRKCALGIPIPGNEMAAELAWRCIGSLSDDAGIRYSQPTSLASTHAHLSLVSVTLPAPPPRRPSPTRTPTTPSMIPSCPPLVPYSESLTSLPLPAKSIPLSRSHLPVQVKTSSVRATMHFGRRKYIQRRDGH